MPVYDPLTSPRPSELDEVEVAAIRLGCLAGRTSGDSGLLPDHINVECLGNTVPHLHIALIRALFRPRWGRPVWTTSRDERRGPWPTTPNAKTLAHSLREHIEKCRLTTRSSRPCGLNLWRAAGALGHSAPAARSCRRFPAAQRGR